MVMKYKWICYKCNLKFEDKETVKLHEEVTGHIGVGEFTKWNWIVLLVQIWMDMIHIVGVHVIVKIGREWMTNIEERIKFASSAIRENHIEEYILKKELKKLLEEFENGN